MTSTLGSEPVQSVLTRLRATGGVDDETYKQRVRAREAELGAKFSGRERAELGAAAPLSIGPEAGLVLYALTLVARPKLIVEFGASLGCSTIYLASAVRDIGSGSIVTTELLPDKARQAVRNLADAGLDDLVELRVGDALTTLTNLDATIGLLFLDGSNDLYLRVLELLEPRLSAHALVIADMSANEPQHARYRGYMAERYPTTEISLDAGLVVSAGSRWSSCGDCFSAPLSFDRDSTAARNPAHGRGRVRRDVLAHGPFDQRVLEVLKRLEQEDAGERATGVPRAQRARQIAPTTGRFLFALAAARSGRVLEVGGSRGYSAIWLACAVQAHGGCVVSIEHDPLKARAWRANVAEAGLADVAQLVEGNAFEMLPELQPGFDLAFIDAEKEDYERLYRLVRAKLAPRALIVADNVTSHAHTLGAYSAARRADPSLMSVTVPLDRGLELSVLL